MEALWGNDIIHIGEHEVPLPHSIHEGVSQIDRRATFNISIIIEDIESCNENRMIRYEKAATHSLNGNQARCLVIYGLQGYGCPGLSLTGSAIALTLLLVS
ncbi:hypothetical protein Gotur_022979 [Gossypium turneri]